MPKLPYLAEVGALGDEATDRGVEVRELGDAHQQRIPRQLPGSALLMHVPDSVNQ